MKRRGGLISIITIEIGDIWLSSGAGKSRVIMQATSPRLILIGYIEFRTRHAHQVEPHTGTWYLPCDTGIIIITTRLSEGPPILGVSQA